jgi:hypothetical protein
MKKERSLPLTWTYVCSTYRPQRRHPAFPTGSERSTRHLPSLRYTRGVEARVICKNLHDAANACALLDLQAKRESARFDTKRLELILPNGSAVAVKLEIAP